MDGFKAAAAAICAASGAVCAVGGLVSGTRLKDQMKLLLDMIMLLVVITPFVSGGIAVEMPDTSGFTADLGSARERYIEQLEEQTGSNICDVLREQITAAGISCGEISAEVNISKDMSISISRVTVSSDSFEAAAEIIRRSIGSDTEVVNGDP